MSITIEQVEPPVGYYHYSNERSQGSLLRQTSKWPLPAPSMIGCMSNASYWMRDEVAVNTKPRDRSASCVLPSGFSIGDAYVDRMQMWDSAKWAKFVSDLLGDHPDDCGLNERLRRCPEDNLIKAAANYFGKPVVSARVVYYYNCATGYDCQRIDFIYEVEQTSE